MATRKKLTAALKVRAFIKTNPDAKPTEIAKALNVSASVVYGVLWRDKQASAPKLKTKTKTQTKKAEWSAFVPSLLSAPMPIVREEPMPITMEEPKADMVNHPPHYTVGGIEVIDFIKAKLTTEEFRGYLQGNILKYSSRVGFKGDAAEDVGKLIWYANKLQEALPA